jgi:hypothetical protein
MRVAQTLLVLAAVLCTAAAQAGVIPIVDYDVPVETGSGKPADLAAISQAIVEGGKSKAWDIVPAADGNALRGTLTWNKNKHTIMLDIQTGPTLIRLRYVNSVNMKYGMRNGYPMIHDIYNRQLEDLSRAIRTELQKL